MKTVSLSEQLAGGVDQRWRPKTNHASDIVNMRVDDEGLGWVNDRGWEPLDPYSAFGTVSIYVDEKPIHSVGVWTRDQNAETYYLHEQEYTDAAGVRYLALRWVHPNNNGSGSTLRLAQTLHTKRTVPQGDDPGTQYVPFGRFLLVCNGHELPLKFWGGRRVEEFGWSSRPAPPTVMSPDPSYFDGTDINAANTIATETASPRGMGDATQNTQNMYRYKVSWVSATGSESPLSTSAMATWTATSADAAQRYAVQLRDVPFGPPGTVARRIYRTKNLKNVDTQGDAVYFFVAQIDDNSAGDFMDIHPDQELVVTAPASTASVVLPSGLKYAAGWNGRVWMAGGPGNELRVIYSDAGAPEQFGAFAFFDVSVRQGGAITGLMPYFDSLLVFRENAIDLISSNDENTGFTMQTLDPRVGTTGTNTFTLVPGLGVFFLGYDGIYLISGERGGISSTLQVQKVSQPVQREVNRISIGALARATAAYSTREKEYWVHYPVDGQTRCSRGIVYHPLLQAWSLRHATSTSGPGAFEFNGITTNPAGWFVLAPQTQAVTGLGTTRTIYNLGLQVWSACGHEGKSMLVTLSDAPLYTKTSVADGPSVLGIWSSTWTDFGDDAVKKRAISVLVDVITMGHRTISLEVATDYQESYTVAGTIAPAVADVFGSSKEETVYGASTDPDDTVAVIGTAKWAAGRVTRLRWDVRTGLVSWFKWRLSSPNPFQVIQYRVEFVPADRQVLNVKAQ